MTDLIDKCRQNLLHQQNLLTDPVDLAVDWEFNFVLMELEYGTRYIMLCFLYEQL